MPAHNVATEKLFLICSGSSIPIKVELEVIMFSPDFIVHNAIGSAPIGDGLLQGGNGMYPVCSIM
jgi:hypothetical protein